MQHNDSITGPELFLIMIRCGWKTESIEGTNIVIAKDNFSWQITLNSPLVYQLIEALEAKTDTNFKYQFETATNK